MYSGSILPLNAIIRSFVRNPDLLAESEEYLIKQVAPLRVADEESKKLIDDAL